MLSYQFSLGEVQSNAANACQASSVKYPLQHPSNNYRNNLDIVTKNLLIPPNSIVLCYRGWIKINL